MNPALESSSVCGQSKGTNEEVTASAVAGRLQKLGFDPWVAVREQTLRGLKENIFEQLAKSEYYIFVDFKREELANTAPPVCRGSLFSHQALDANTAPPVCRGSLFSHQELALASYLQIPVLAF